MFTVTLFAKGNNKAAPQVVGGEFVSTDAAEAFILGEFIAAGWDGGELTTSERFGVLTVECVQHGYQIEPVRR